MKRIDRPGSLFDPDYFQKFDPNQPRADDGKWSETGAGGSGGGDVKPSAGGASEPSGSDGGGAAAASRLASLEAGQTLKLPKMTVGSGKFITTYEGYTATYVGMQGKNRTYRILDKEGRFAWNLSHKKLSSVLR